MFTEDNDKVDNYGSQKKEIVSERRVRKKMDIYEPRFRKQETAEHIAQWNL